MGFPHMGPRTGLCFSCLAVRASAQAGGLSVVSVLGPDSGECRGMKTLGASPVANRTADRVKMPRSRKTGEAPRRLQEEGLVLLFSE